MPSSPQRVALHAVPSQTVSFDAEPDPGSYPRAPRCNRKRPRPFSHVDDDIPHPQSRAAGTGPDGTPIYISSPGPRRAPALKSTRGCLAGRVSVLIDKIISTLHTGPGGPSGDCTLATLPFDRRDFCPESRLLQTISIAIPKRFP